jgi:predicted GH43/DUF377 family glycosyl hydrolase
MKKIYFISMLSIFSLNLFCQVYWTKYPDNPVMVPGFSGEWDAEYVYPGSVIYNDTTYHIWYTGGIDNDTSRIGHATSPDGVTWTKDPNNPVLDVGPNGTWDESSMFGGGALVIDSIFHLWYTGHTGLVNNANFLIGHATSTDGVTWTKDTNNPVLDVGPDGEWDDTWISAGSVVYDGSEYHMWYSAWNGGSESVRIGHATSSDAVTWTKDANNPVLTYEAAKWDYPRVDFPAVVFDGTSYHMWYSGGEYTAWQIGYATSEDGSTWAKHDNNPVLLHGPSGSWDEDMVASCVVMDSSGVKYKMWYFGNKTNATGGVGYAESDTRVPYLSVIESKPVYDSTDKVVAEIVLDGIIYIVPDGTSPVIDSILKYKVASVDATANTEAEIPLTDLSIGKYTIIAVSSMGFVSTNPYLIEVVVDAASPIIELAKDTVYQGDTIIATSNKEGIIYLVHKNTPLDMAMITHPANLKGSEIAVANTPVSFSSTDLKVDRYRLYAVDIYGIISDPETVTVQPVVGVEENINTGISIYPNPANDLIIIEINNVGQYSIELNSINGQLLYIDKMEGPTHQIDLSSFQKGLYLITIRYRNYLRTEKIIKY